MNSSNSPSKLREWAFYVVFVFATGLVVVGILHYGRGLEDGRMPSESATEAIPWTAAAWEELGRNLSGPLAKLLLQVLLIVTFSRLCALIVRRFGQPHVIGEMLAGIILGKSVFAALFPGVHEFVFPAHSGAQLLVLSQVGLILFMFVVGLELDLKNLKSRVSSATLISHASILAPFAMGSCLALLLYRHYSPANVTFTQFALFMGIAMSVTAFPVLAKILQEKKLTKTPLGAIAITCAAVDDVSAWALLAVVIGIVHAGTLGGALATLGLTLIYVGLMFRFVPTLFKNFLFDQPDSVALTHRRRALVLIFLFGSALMTELIGIHALFGAFLAGIVMPTHPGFREDLIGRVEALTQTILMPLFFAYSGLRTQINLLSEWQDWAICGLVIVVAVIGKLGASTLAARWAGHSWRESLSLGSLMNTRGLVELVILNIGYDLGILSPTVFTMMVIMALVTTMMTGPLLTLFCPRDYLELCAQGKYSPKSDQRTS